METAVQIFGAIHLLVIGLSHILAPRAWADFFICLRARGESGVFVVGFMSLGFGSIIAAFHNVWSGIPAALTVIGWAQVVKALIYFCFPRFGLRRLEMVSVERARVFAFVILAGLLIYHLAVTGIV